MRVLSQNMINILKKNRRNIFFWTLVFGVYFISRFINLTSIPIFTDEAIYLRWSQIISGDLHYLYLPLTDGKPPLFMWLVALVMKMFPIWDPLFVGRATSVLLGSLGLTGIYFTSYQLFKSKFVSGISVLFYLISPFTFFYDRFALADSLLAAIGLWSLGLGVMLIKNLKLKTAIILGVVIGLGLWTKSPAIEFFLLLPSLFLLNRQKIIRYLILLVVVFIISRLIYTVILFLPQAYVISLKNMEFTIPISQFIQNPFLNFPGNLQALSVWTYSYLTWPMLILVSVSLFFAVKLKSVPKLILIGYFFSHFFFMVFFNKVIYPRFLLMFFPLLLILAAKGIEDLKKFKTLIILIVLIFTINAPLANTDSEQYLNSWSAGYGIKEINSFFINKKAVVGVEGTFGLMPYALELYQKDHMDLTIKPFWPLPDKMPLYIDYLIVYQRDKIPQNWPVELIMKFKQGTGNDYMKLYKIIVSE